MASLKQIQGEFKIQVGALAARDQVATELADCDGVGLAIQANVVHDILAAIYPVLNICIEVVAYLFVIRKVIQRDLGERQKAGDLLKRRHGHVTKRKLNVNRRIVLNFLLNVSLPPHQSEILPIKSQFLNNETILGPPLKHLF